MEKDRVLAEIREAIELNRTVKQKNNDALSHAEYLLKREDEYNRGLNDAWELAKKIVLSESDGGMSVKDFYSIFDKTMGDEDVLKKFTPQEALAKLESYEQSKKEIKVGDVVFNDDTMETGVVTLYENGDAFMLYNDGSCGKARGNLTKTGKHIDISALLEEIEEE